DTHERDLDLRDAVVVGGGAAEVAQLRALLLGALRLADRDRRYRVRRAGAEIAGRAAVVGGCRARLERRIRVVGAGEDDVVVDLHEEVAGLVGLQAERLVGGRRRAVGHPTRLALLAARVALVDEDRDIGRVRTAG